MATIKLTQAQLNKKLKDKEDKLATIVGRKEAKKLMSKALLLVKQGKKPLSDIID